MTSSNEAFDSWVACFGQQLTAHHPKGFKPPPPPVVEVTQRTANTDTFQEDGGEETIELDPYDPLQTGHFQDTPTGDVLSSKKVVAIYFCGAWGAPCAGFTAHLCEIYEAIQHVHSASNGGRSPFEVVFASLDRDLTSYNAQFDSMPWLALPYRNRKAVGSLAQRFGIVDFPSLVLLKKEDDGSCSVMARNGIHMLTECPSGFPWSGSHISRSVAEVLGDHPDAFLCIKQTKVAGPHPRVSYTARLKGNVILLLFSAYWSEAGREFTALLAKVYKKMLNQKKHIEVVFVSLGHDEQEFENYLTEMPAWLAVPFEDEQRRRAIQLQFNVNMSALPQLVILDGDEKNSLITTEGVFRIQDDTWGLKFPWRRPHMIDVASMGTEELNTSPCVVLLAEGDNVGKQESKEFVKILDHVAKAHVQKCDDLGKVQDILYFAAKKDSSVSMQIRQICGLPVGGNKWICLILDLRMNGAVYQMRSPQLTEKTVNQFIDSWREGRLATRKQAA